jgi:competence protein ComEC
LAFALSLALVVAHPFRPQLTPGRLELSALDVGQGESLFLSLPGGGTMLLDGGGMPDYGGTVRRAIDIGEAVVSPYLWSRSIRKLDVVAISHAHADHMAGIPAVLENFKAGEVWIAAAQPREDYAMLLPLLAQRGIPLVTLHRGDVREMGGVLFEVLGPAEDSEGKPLHNDDSLVLRARYGRHSFLLTGDIEQRGEIRLVEEDLLPGDTVLKVAHHGSRTSSQPSFLERVRPAFAIISAGFQSPFGHPHPEVVERLHQGNAAILRTDREGLVTIASDGQRLFVSTFRRERVH